jgi:hypothetical protein
MNNICSAIENFQLISFLYDDHSCVIEPHTYGENHKGNSALRGYQIRGGSESGEYHGWKIFLRDEMHDVTVLEETFSGTRRGYKRGDKAFATKLCQL